MRPLTQDDLLPLDEFVQRRRELFEAHSRYLDRYRRVRIGPKVTLLFENRQTLWFRVQEVLRVARLTEPNLIEAELGLYNRLLPGPDRLQAALLLETDTITPVTEQLAAWKDLRGEELLFQVGEKVAAQLVTCRPEDRAVGAAHWVNFVLPPRARERLRDPSRAAYFEIIRRTYSHQSPVISEDIRQSLLEDLELSDRDG